MPPNPHHLHLAIPLCDSGKKTERTALTPNELCPTSSNQEKKAGEAMQRLDAAIITLQRGEAELAAKHFAHLAENSSGELKDISRLWQARALAEGRNAEAAVKTLHALAENPAGDELVWRDLACLRLMAAGEESPKSCTGTGDSPLKSQRLEWHASQLWQQGEAKEARALLDKIAADETAPKAQRERARHLRRAIITKE